MNDPESIKALVLEFLPIIITLIVWDGIWKLIALWKAAQNKQVVWFIAIAIFNTLGLLPMIYILLHRKKNDSAIN